MPEVSVGGRRLYYDDQGEGEHQGPQRHPDGATAETKPVVMAEHAISLVVD